MPKTRSRLFKKKKPRKSKNVTSTVSSTTPMLVYIECPSQYTYERVIPCDSCCRQYDYCPSYSGQACNSMGSCDGSTGACSCATSSQTGYVIAGSCCQSECKIGGQACSASSECCVGSCIGMSPNKVCGSATNYDPYVDSLHPCD